MLKSGNFCGMGKTQLRRLICIASIHGVINLKDYLFRSWLIEIGITFFNKNNWIRDQVSGLADCFFSLSGMWCRQCGADWLDGSPLSIPAMQAYVTWITSLFMKTGTKHRAALIWTGWCEKRECYVENLSKCGRKSLTAQLSLPRCAQCWHWVLEMGCWSSPLW